MNVWSCCVLGMSLLVGCSAPSEDMPYCDAAAWVATLHGQPVAQGEGPEGTFDSECRPVMERWCRTACDCKFVVVGCDIWAASRSSETEIWGTLEAGPDGQCTRYLCIGVAKHTDYSLECVSGECGVRPIADY